MKYNFTKYSHIIIDYSSMFVNWDSELMNQLADSDKLLFAPTFECECRHFLKCVPERVRDVYWSNLNAIHFSANKVCNTWGVTDTYGLANGFSANYGKTLVVVANLSLEDKIIFSGIDVDVYSWHNESVIKHSDFTNEQNNRPICKEKTHLPYYEVTEGDDVFSDRGKYVLVGNPNDVGFGTESNIYKLSGHSDLLAKIYKLDDEDGLNVLTEQKLQNIINLQELGDGWGVEWLALPQEVLYSDAALTKPIGYLMKKISGQFLSEHPMFACGDIEGKFEQNNCTRVRDVLDICILFVSQFMFLSANGINLTDYNDKNFALATQGNKKIINMIDTDSYCYIEYISKCNSYADCLIKPYECNNKLDLLKFCEESIYIYIFTRLTLNPDYKPLYKGKFRYRADKMAHYIEKNNQNALIKWKSIPENLQKLYIDVFENNKTPSTGVLLYELERANKQAFVYTEYVDLYKPLLDLCSVRTDPETSLPIFEEHKDGEEKTSNIKKLAQQPKKKSKLKSLFDFLTGDFLAYFVGAEIGCFVVMTIFYFIGVVKGEVSVNWGSYFNFLLEFFMNLFE